MKPTVVLLHGLARTRRSMERLRASLEAEGFPTWSRTYPSRRLGIADSAAAVAEQLRADVPEGPRVAVTHSLGGILARYIGAELPFEAAVMLAPPNDGSLVAVRMADNPLFKWWFGPAGQQLTAPEGWPPPPRPFGVIAGTGGQSVKNPPSLVVSGYLPRDEPHDGTVAVFEARHPDMAAFATVDATHTWIMNHPAVVPLVLGFLAERRFPEVDGACVAEP